MTTGSGFKSATLLEVPLLEKGTYSISATAEHATSYAQQDGQWKTDYEMPVDQAPFLVNLTPAEIKATARKLTSTSHTQVQTYVSRDIPGTVPKLSESASGNSPIALKFARHPNRIQYKDGLKFTLLINGKPTAGIKFTLHAAGEHHDDEEDGKNQAQDSHTHEPAGFVSDKQGEVTIPLVHAGQYLIDSRYPEVKKGTEPATGTYYLCVNHSG